MRPDLGKCVIEAPRRGSHNKSVKVRAYGRIIRDEEGYEYEGISKIPCSRKGANLMLGDCKDFSDKLGPLHGYLENSCGRPWNAVFSEISRVLGRDGSEGIRHIKDTHIDVAVHTYRHENGHVYSDDARHNYAGHQVDYSYGYSRYQFYVEPETGILRKCIGVSKPVETIPIESIALSANSGYYLIDKIWYYREFTETDIQVVYGIVSGVKQYRWAKAVTWTIKRQLGKKELKKMCLPAHHQNTLQNSIGFRA